MIDDYAADIAVDTVKCLARYCEEKDQAMEFFMS